MAITRRSFTAEYRVEAAHRVIDSGRTIIEVARELGFGGRCCPRTLPLQEDIGLVNGLVLRLDDLDTIKFCGESPAIRFAGFSRCTTCSIPMRVRFVDLRGRCD